MRVLYSAGTYSGLSIPLEAGGTYSASMGSGEEDPGAYDEGQFHHEVDLPYEYKMARYPITVSQLREYVKATGSEPPGGSDNLRALVNSPAVNVSWYEALSFCEWLTVRLQKKGKLKEGWIVRLPSEAEWEKAARGKEVRIYPWGLEFDPERANTGESSMGDVSTVGCFPGGASEYGCEEMSGNVWEWTRTLWSSKFGYPYEPSDGREDLQAPGEVLRVLRGASYFSHSRFARCAARCGFAPDFRDVNVGFRVLLSPHSPLDSDFSDL